MCGVTGFYNLNSKLGKEELVLMTEKLGHRGPDSTGYFIEDNIGLGHKRLSIIDLTTNANQPMQSANGRFVISYNGEVYNFKTLIKKYDLTTKTTSDTEVILELFSKLGVNFVKELNGMFVFVIYDKLTKSFFIYRDRIGIKPLYYFLDDDYFVFGSELKAITAITQIKAKLTINQDAIQNYLHLGYIPQPLSIYDQIQKFPSGHYAIFQNKTLDLLEYYSPISKIADDTFTDEIKAKKTLVHILNKSIELRMVSDVPFGTFLSGGIDSSTVTAIAQSQSEIPINTFSIGFEGKKNDEIDYARKIAQHLQTKHHELIVTEQDGLELIEKMVDVFDEPFADSSAIPTMLVSKMAKKHVSMTLSGDGGDELFHGYGTYEWAERLSSSLLFSLRKPVSFALNTFGGNKNKRAALVFKNLTEQNYQTHIFSQEQCLFSEKETINLLKTNKLITFNYINKLSNRELTIIEKQAIFDLEYYLKDDLLVKVDRASMFHSLETRVPLLDHTLVEFALNLDPSLKTQHETTKYLLRQVLYDHVPKKLFNRPKQGFSIPLEKWMQNDLNFLIEKYLNEESIESTNILQYCEVEKLKVDFAKGKTYLYNRLWALIVLQMFLLRN